MEPVGEETGPEGLTYYFILKKSLKCVTFSLRKSARTVSSSVSGYQSFGSRFEVIQIFSAKRGLEDPLISTLTG